MGAQAASVSVGRNPPDWAGILGASQPYKDTAVAGHQIGHLAAAIPALCHLAGAMAMIPLATAPGAEVAA